MQPMTNSTILFVCSGNTCRSPMAHGIAQEWLRKNGYEGWLAVSAGTFATEGAPASSETINALSQRGITFEGTSKPLTREMILSAHIVLCMSKTHVDTARQLSGESAKIELFDLDGPISDPAGQDQLVYDAIAEKMEKLIAQRLETIIKKTRIC